MTTTQTQDQTVEDVIARLRQQQVELNPVDRYSPLGRFQFLPPQKVESVSEDGQTIHTGQAAALAPLVGKDGAGDIGIPRLQLSDLALQQFCQRIEYPLGLLKRLPPNLNNLNVNWILQNSGQHDDRTSLLRTVRDGQVRAVLGSRYTPLDDLEVLELCAPFIKDGIVRWEGFGEVSTHLSISWPGTDTETGLERGVHIMNSEVGMRSVTIMAVAYRPACANILPASSMGRAGGAGESDVFLRRNPFNGGKAQKAEQFSGWRFSHTGDRGRLEAFITQAMEDSVGKYEGIVAKYRQGLNEQIDAIQAITDLSGAGGLTQEQLRQALTALAEEYSPTVTGVANAFTKSAQYQHDPEERALMQSLGATALHVYLN